MFKVVFTDLDGTLLDENYSWENSRPGIEALKKAGIPLIFCTSKTPAENLHYQEALGIHHPFIAENGSAVFIPKDYFPPGSLAGSGTNPRRLGGRDWEVLALGKPLAEINRVLKEAVEVIGLDFSLFTEIPEDELSEITGLPLEMTRLAKMKEYNQTLYFVRPPGEKEVWRLAEFLARKGLRLVKGSRFFNVHGLGADKGKAVGLLLSFYRKVHGEVLSFGIGDAANDLPMLRAVDRGFLVMRRGKWVEAEGVEKVPLENGRGFTEVILRHVV